MKHLEGGTYNKNDATKLRKNESPVPHVENIKKESKSEYNAITRRVDFFGVSMFLYGCGMIIDIIGVVALLLGYDFTILAIGFGFWVVSRLLADK